ncbi:alpha/beta hydrolase [Sinomicrobium soli]|uniref:alpha/beta hydrolase n=1 Tax=Sinomicrobium sp. N-1-3-6 TaxID=2219864 RepID=UPI001374BA7B|nr:alpha/beta hydrolase-fold protein [Sinomicrobium sp. N-1-3-6]
MRAYFSLLPALVFCFGTFAQQPVVIGHSYGITSEILGEEREIEVQLPENYDNSRFAKTGYPVLYVLDGEFNFSFTAALERFNTKFLYRPYPEMIVIGIKNTDRTRDFTPTNVPVTGRHGRARFGTSGGADDFIRFLEEELKPFVNSEFRTDGYDILLGHSFGGLFTVYTLLEHPELFDSYIALDPSLWWDDRLVYRKAEDLWKTTDFGKKGLFVALAYEAPENAKDRFKHGKTIRDFCEHILMSNPGNNLRTNWKYYPEHDHGLVPIPATMDALSFLFEGTQLPVKEVPLHPGLVAETYGKMSRKLGHELKPDESLLYELIKYVKSTGKTESARELLNYARNTYPGSAQLKTLNVD